jgi:ABC-type dipeptide/oligopeptide/nickel transport system permease subunit
MEQFVVPETGISPKVSTDIDLTEPSRRQRPLHYFIRDKKALVGLIILAAILLGAVFAPLISPYDPNAQDFDFLEAPSREHILGTDDLGRDFCPHHLRGANLSFCRRDNRCHFSRDRRADGGAGRLLRRVD